MWAFSSHFFYLSMAKQTFGRTVIYTSVDEVTRENIVELVSNADSVHEENASDIEYLYNYYRGEQPILERTKEVRPEINNMIVENRAKEIVDFWVGYAFGEPIQYIGRGDVDSEKIARLNNFMLSEDKESKDVELATWQMICGTSYRMCLPDDGRPDGVERFELEEEECPIEIYTLNPKNTAVVYSSGIGNRPMFAYIKTTNAENEMVYEGYTRDAFFRIVADELETWTPHALGRIPIIEYPANEARLGAFEIVLTMLDAINDLDSNRLDNVEEIVQALIVATNCTFPEGTTPTSLRQQGIVTLTSADGMEQKLQLLTEKIDQSQTQELKNDLYDSVLTICAMPNRNGGGSTKDTGVAVIYRDGWSAAETRAKKIEMTFKKSEREFLKLALSILRASGGLDLNFSDLEIKFTRRNYEGLEQKAGVLDKLLSNPKIAPRLAFMVSNLFPDPEEAYRESLPFIEGAEVNPAEETAIE